MNEVLGLVQQMDTVEVTNQTTKEEPIAQHPAVFDG